MSLNFHGSSIKLLFDPLEEFGCQVECCTFNDTE